MIEEVKAEIEDAKEYTKHHKRKVKDGLLIALFGLITISGGLFVGKEMNKPVEKETEKIETIDLEKEIGSSKYSIVSEQDLNISEDTYNKIKQSINVQTSSIYTLEDDTNAYKYIFLETSSSLYVFDESGNQLLKTTDLNYDGIKGIFKYQDSEYIEYHTYDKDNCLEQVYILNVTNNKVFNLYNLKSSTCK